MIHWSDSRYQFSFTFHLFFFYTGLVQLRQSVTETVDLVLDVGWNFSGLVFVNVEKTLW